MQPNQDAQNVDLPERADSENKSLIKTSLPPVTTFSKKAIAVTLAIFLISCLIGALIAFSPERKATQAEQAEERMKNMEKNIKRADGSMPDDFNKVPSTLPTKDKEKPAPAASAKTVTSSTKPASNPPMPATPPIPNVNNAELKELLEARKSPIKFFADTNAAQNNPSQNVLDAVATILKGNENSLNSSDTAAGVGGQQQEDPNMQLEKRNFLKESASEKFYLSSRLESPVSPYEVKAGTIIPAVMVTGINSDLPGKIVGQVSQNVYDTVAGKYLLIPQGTRIIGTYDSMVAYGQQRVLIVWNRIILPNGDSLDLEGMQGVDAAGYTGLTGKVNNHESRLLNGVLITSILSAGAKIATGNEVAGRRNFQQQASSGLAESIAQTGEKLAEKNLSIQPTIEISPGAPFNVFVNKDMVLRPYSDS